MPVNRHFEWFTRYSSKGANVPECASLKIRFDSIKFAPTPLGADGLAKREALGRHAHFHKDPKKHQHMPKVPKLTGASRGETQGGRQTALHACTSQVQSPGRHNATDLIGLWGPRVSPQENPRISPERAQRLTFFAVQYQTRRTGAFSSGRVEMRNQSQFWMRSRAGCRTGMGAALLLALSVRAGFLPPNGRIDGLFRSPVACAVSEPWRTR